MSNFFGFVCNVEAKVHEEESILILLRSGIRCGCRLVALSTSSAHSRSTCFYEGVRGLSPLLPGVLSCFYNLGSIENARVVSSCDIFGPSAGLEPNGREFSPSYGMHIWAACKD